MNSLGMVQLSFALGITGTSSMHTYEDDAPTAIVWATLHNNIGKEASLHKRFLKRNLVHREMAQCMNALADKVQK